MTTAAPITNNVVTLNTDINNGNVAALNSVMMLEAYKGVKFTLEMKMTYNLILSFTRTGKKAEFSQSYLAAYLSCSLRTATTVIATLKELGLIQSDPDNRGKGDVDLLEALPIVVEFVKTTEVKRVNNRKPKGKQNVASRPAPSRKPKLCIVENQEQSGDVGFNNGGDDFQHCDPVPIVTNVIDSIQPKEVGAANDPVLPVNGSDNDRSDEVITADVKDDLEMYTQIADNWGVKYNLPEIMHMCRNDCTKAAKRLKGEIDAFHFNAKQSAQQPGQIDLEGNFDYDLDESTADDAGYAF
jgi:hypothetical protein